MDSPIISLFRQGDSSTIWVEVKESQDAEPVVAREMDLAPIVDANDSLQDIEQKVQEWCKTWHDRTVHLSECCQRALRWEHTIIVTNHQVTIRIESVDQAKLVWRYSLNGEWRKIEYPFGRIIMCIDWVGISGLTKAAREEICQLTQKEVQEHLDKIDPRAVRRHTIIREFTRQLPEPIDPPWLEQHILSISTN